MSQFLRPDSNVTRTNFTGGFADIDEAIKSDADYAYQTASTGTLEVGLSNPTATPGAGTTTVRYRLAKVNISGVLTSNGNDATVTMSVYSGSTLIESDQARLVTAGTWNDYEFTPDMSGVSDWTDLRLRLVNSGGGGGGSVRGVGISWAEVEAPDGGLPEITASMSATETGSDAFAATGAITDSASEIVLALVVSETGSDTFSATATAKTNMASIIRDRRRRAKQIDYEMPIRRNIRR